MALTQTQVSQLYVALFGRASEGEGNTFWQAEADQATAANAMLATSAASTYFGTSLESNQAFVEHIYLNTLGKTLAQDPDGIAFWVNALATNSRGFVVAELIKSATDVATAGAAQDQFNNRVEVSNYMAQTVQTAPADYATSTAFTSAAKPTGALNVTSDDATVTTAKGSVDAAVAATVTPATYTLTTGIDAGAAFTGTAGNDTYNASAVIVLDSTALAVVVDTINTLDDLVGGKGTDTLNIVTAVATTNAAPTMTGIENVNIQFKAASTIDLANAVGVTAVSVHNSTAVATVEGTGAATLAVSNQTTAVNFDDSTASALTISLDTVGTAATDIAVDLAKTVGNKATSNVITANNAHVTFSETTASTATTSATIAATGTNEITFSTADLASIATLTVTGAGSVDLTGAAMTALKTLTVADGGVKVNATGGVLETATTGAGADTITAVGATVKSISTGAGNDVVTDVTSGLAATSVVNLGAGNDTYTMATVASAGATITAGEGTDALATTYAIYNLVSAFSAANLAKITGFETLNITTAALATGSIVDLSKIAGLTSAQILGVNTGVAASITNVGATSTVTVKGDIANNDGALTISLADSTGSSDSITVVLNQTYTDDDNATSIVKATSDGSLVLTGIENVTVNSTGNTSVVLSAGSVADTVVNGIAITDANLKALTITGNQAATFSTAATHDALTTINASANTAGVTINASLSDTLGIAITGSATAANTLTGTDFADTITGGSAADTITGGIKGDTLTGNGGNDKFVLAAGDSSIGTGSFDTITDFVANAFGNGTSGAANATGATGVAAASLTGDVIQVAKLALATANLLVDNFTSAADATTYLANHAGSTGIVAAFDSTNQNLYIDNTDDGVADFFVHLTGVTSLTTTAFVVA